MHTEGAGQLCHAQLDVLQCVREELVGEGADAVPFAASSSQGVLANTDGEADSGRFSSYGKGGSAAGGPALVLWALRDAGGRFGAVAASTTGSRASALSGGKLAASAAMKAAGLSEKYDPQQLILWVCARPGNEEDVLEGVQLAAPPESRELHCTTLEPYATPCYPMPATKTSYRGSPTQFRM